MTENKDTNKPMTRKQLSLLIEKKGGIVKKSVVKGLDYLVIGSAGSDKYAYGSKGTKQAKAEEQGTEIISEVEILEALEY